jgi:ribonuclease P protein component
MGPGRVVTSPQEGAPAADRPHRVEARERLTPGEGFPRRYRLAREQDIRHTLRAGRRRRLAHLDVIWTVNAAGHPRMGLVVPRFRSSAVARNRLRRRLREIWRRELQGRQPGWDLLIRVRREAYEASYEALQAQLIAWRDEAMG